MSLSSAYSVRSDTGKVKDHLIMIPLFSHCGVLIRKILVKSHLDFFQKLSLVKINLSAHTTSERKSLQTNN